MRSFLICLAIFCSLSPVGAASGRVMKVLPHLLDLKGRHTVSPSLFDRDAYQAVLRNHPEQRSSIRFDVQWKSKGSPSGPLKLRLEVRGVARGGLPFPLMMEREVTAKGWLSHWASLTLSKEDYNKLSEITAWRVTLWEGTQLLHEQTSFLW
jgi:hypothetical protein